jgi:phage baseplate assembly protein W
MPIPQVTRVNPLDLRKNIAIGVSLPFNGPSGPFNKTYSTKDQTKSNLVNLLLTNRGERLFNPEFGADISNLLFEGINEDLDSTIIDLINSSVNLFMPEIQLGDIIIDKDPDRNSIIITVNYKLKISGQSEQITVQFT